MSNVLLVIHRTAYRAGRSPERFCPANRINRSRWIAAGGQSALRYVNTSYLCGRTLNMNCFRLQVVLLIAAMALRAQVGTGRITGRLTDASGAVVPGGPVKAVNIQTNV